MNSPRVALVTGASRGIGAETAAEFARRGYHVALAARGREALEGVAGRVREAGADALVLAGDLADLAFAEEAVRAAVARWGRIDALINNAAWREIVTMRQITLESWERTLRVCLTTPAFMARWAAADMERRGRGVIVNVSSVQSQLASGFAPAYIASKGALDALSYDLAALYGPRGIRVVAINPGAIDTEMSNDYPTSEPGGAPAPGGAPDPAPGRETATARLRASSEDVIPLRRWGTAGEIARTIAWLASDDASYVTGTTILADGGLKTHMLPYSLKRLMSPEQYP